MAGLITLAASVWDGIAALLIGIAADRGGGRAFVRLNALPLAMAFVAIYLPAPLHGVWLAMFALLAHMLFRTLYVAVNVPYAALTVRIAPDSASRSRIAGLRMILGAGAGVVVAVGTQGSLTFAGAAGRPDMGYMMAAIPLGVAATVLLFVVGGMRSSTPGPATARRAFRLAAVMAVIAGNRAFLMLNMGIFGGVAAMAVWTRAVPYYFKYQVGDAAAGSAALAMMGAAGVLAVPLWMACAARFGHRAQWQISALVTAVGLVLLLLLRPASAPVAQALFVLFQAGGQGLFFGFWALAPDAIEHGGRPGDPRMDTFLFGVAALLQKVALGIAVAVFGGLLSAVGYLPRDHQPAGVLHGLAWLTAGLPLIPLLGASLAMLRFPRSLAPAPKQVSG